MAKYEEGAVERAKQQGEYLLVIELDGRYAKRETIRMSGTCGPRTAARVRKLLLDLASPKTRLT